MDTKVETIKVEDKRLSNVEMMGLWDEIGKALLNAVIETSDLLDVLKDASEMHCKLFDELQARQYGWDKPF
jgi:hypothetical protein